MRKYMLVIALLVATLPLCAYARDYVRVTLPAAEELPVASVHAISHDDEGYAWISTFEGLVRSDGHTMVLIRNDYRTPNVFSSNVINSVCDGHCGLLWVGTRQGLYYIDKREGYAVHRFEQNATLTRSSIPALCIAADSTVWAVGGNLLAHIGRQGELLDTIPLPWEGNGEKWVNDVTEDAQGRLWIAQCRGGLLMLEHGCLRSLPWDYAYDPNALVACGQGVWVGAWGGGVVWHDGKHAEPLSGSSPEVIDVALNPSDSTLWVSSMQELEGYKVGRNGETQRIDLAGLALGNNLILDKLEYDARNGCVWVASMASHPFAIVRENLLPSRPPKLDMGGGRAVVSGGQVFFENNRTQMSVYDMESQCFLPIERPARTSDVMTPDGRGGCWSCWPEGDSTALLLTQIESSGLVQTRHVVSLPGRCTAIRQIDGTVWIGTAGGCLYRWDGNLQNTATSLPAIKHVAVLGATLCLGTAKGVFLRQPNGTTHCLLGDADITCMAAGGDSVLWLGSVDGRIYRVSSNGRVQRDDAVWPYKREFTNMAVDSLGHLWVQSSTLVREYNPLTRTGRNIRATELGVACLNNLCSVGNQMLLIASASSIFLRPMPQLGNASFLETLCVSQIDVDGEIRMTAPDDRLLTLPASVKDVALSLTTLQMLNSSRLTYAYRLVPHGSPTEDAGTPWIELPRGQATLHFSRLHRGWWDLQVTSTDSESCTSRPVVLMTLHRLPAWWETWWAICLYILIVAVCTVYALRLWHYVRSLQRLYAEAIERRKTIMLQSVEVSSQAEAVSEADDLLQRSIALVEQHLDDTLYGVEQLAADLAMSRMTLYRKMQLLVRESPADFIRGIRLKNAAALLRNKQGMTVSEVADATGFASQSSFRQQFKKMFGVSPSEYK